MGNPNTGAPGAEGPAFAEIRRLSASLWSALRDSGSWIPGRRRRRGTAGEPPSPEQSPEETLLVFESVLRESEAARDDPRSIERIITAVRRVHRHAPWVTRNVSRRVRSHHPDDESLRSAIESMLAGIDLERPGWRALSGADGTLTVMFSDIAGSTTLAQQIGDDAWIEVIREHNALVRDQIALHHGREISNRGDGFMITFPRPAQAVRCAIAIQQAVDGRALGGGEEPIRLHIGIHTGRPAKHEGSFYGTDVNIAARIADRVAGPGEILVTDAVQSRLDGRDEFQFGAAASVELDGLSGEHLVHTVSWRAPAR